MPDNRFPNDSLLVSAAWLAERLVDPDLRLVEVTPPGSGYVLSHIPGAVYLDMSAVLVIDSPAPADPGRLMPDTPEILARLGLDHARHIVIYDEIGGTRATQIFWLLEYLGYDRVSVLEGGLERWLAEGRPTTRRLPAPPPVAPPIVRRADRLATAEWLAARLAGAGNGLVVVDCRTPEEYAAGHIPGAHNRSWEANLTRRAYRAFRDAAELQSELTALGATATGDVVTYCGMGERSSHTYFALRLLGYARARNYQGSWMEWEARPDLPRDGGS